MNPPQKLYAVETGEYEQRDVLFVTDTPEGAEQRIHEMYPLVRYRTRFSPLTKAPLSEDSFEIYVRGFDIEYSISFKTGYSIMPMEYWKE